MRKRFDIKLIDSQTAIKNIKVPTNSRDELPPVLLGLQWIFINQKVHEQVFQLLEEKIYSKNNHTGRHGMDLWHILVLGVVRLTLNCDYDRLEYLVHSDMYIRQIMGLDGFCPEKFGKGFNQKTISDNVHYIDNELLYKINEIVLKEGGKLFKKKMMKK